MAGLLDTSSRSLLRHLIFSNFKPQLLIFLANLLLVLLGALPQLMQQQLSSHPTRNPVAGHPWPLHPPSHSIRESCTVGLLGVLASPRPCFRAGVPTFSLDTPTASSLLPLFFPVHSLMVAYRIFIK